MAFFPRCVHWLRNRGGSLLNRSIISQLMMSLDCPCLWWSVSRWSGPEFFAVDLLLTSRHVSYWLIFFVISVYGSVHREFMIQMKHIFPYRLYTCNSPISAKVVHVYLVFIFCLHPYDLLLVLMVCLLGFPAALCRVCVCVCARSFTGTGTLRANVYSTGANWFSHSNASSHPLQIFSL